MPRLLGDSRPVRALLASGERGATDAIVPAVAYVPVWAVTTVILVAAGAGASALWLRSALRRLGIGLRSGPAAAA